MNRTLRHPTTSARWTKATAFAAKWYNDRVDAIVTFQSDKSLNLEIAFLLSPELRPEINMELKAIFENASSVTFKFSMLYPRHFSLGTSTRTQPDGSSITSPVSNIVSPETRQAFLLQLLTEMPQQTPSIILDYATDFGRMFNVNADLLPRNGWTTLKASASWNSMQWPSIFATRLNSPNNNATIILNPTMPAMPMLLNLSLNSFLKAIALDIKANPGYRPQLHVRMLQDLQELTGFCQAIDRSLLATAVDEVLAAVATSETGKYYTTIKNDLETFKVKCLVPLSP